MPTETQEIELICNAPRAEVKESSLKINASKDWQFRRMENNEPPVSFEAVGADESKWENVMLPHTPRIEEAFVQYPFQGFCWYRKNISFDAAWTGSRVVIEFGAGMQIADVWVNGGHRLRHLGGYLPFSIDLTDDYLEADVVEIMVRLDNRDTEECPPGKPIAGLDFSCFGGLYREAWIHVTSHLHVSDPLRANQEAGGGVFVRCEDVTKESARVLIKTHVLNEGGEIARRCVVQSKITDGKNREIALDTSYPVMINAGEGHHIHQEIEIRNPALWHPDSPNLYVLETSVFQNGKLVDRVSTRFGIRHLAVKNRFLLNGEEFRIRGTNRHQEYPWIGNAVPANAHRRDAMKIKEAGFNFVRLSHYPQDTAFLDACDELGILVQAAIPGWQQFWYNPSFIGRSFQDVRELVRRDRNHPSIVFWEPNLNETGVGEDGGGHADWCRTAYELTHAEYPGNQCLTFGDDYPVKPGWDWDVTGMFREYGDFNFGGNESTSRHARGEGEKALLQQTWNYLWTYNYLSARYENPNTVYFGCATWVMFDYNRGYYHKPCLCGMMDMFRLPKFVYRFYQSQRSPHLQPANPGSGPIIFIASLWNEKSGSEKLVVFSNCERVKLYLNDQPVGDAGPDSGPDTEYNSEKEINLATIGETFDNSGGNSFDGGNARHMEHPPFTFRGIAYEPGMLRAEGWIDSKKACETAVGTPGKPASLSLEIDWAGVPLDAERMDAVFVRAHVLDGYQRPVPDAGCEVRFAMEGPGRLVGYNIVRAEAGIATILLQTWGEPGRITINASAHEIGQATIEAYGNYAE